MAISSRKPLCLVVGNTLLAAFLSQILTVRFKVHLLNTEDFSCLRWNSKLLAKGAVFVLDRGTLPSPIGLYLNAVRLRNADARIIVIDGDMRPQDMCELALQGAHGFLTYSQVKQGIVRAALAVARGQLCIARDVLELCVNRIRKRSPKDESTQFVLTRRQVQIMDLLKQNLSNKEISFRLDISENTVKFHLAKIFSKFGVHDRNMLVPLELFHTAGSNGTRIPEMRSNLSTGNSICGKSVNI